MNPNSQNQRWSLWTFTISRRGKGHSKMVTTDELRTNFSRFVKKLFQTSVGQMRIILKRGRLVVQVRVEGPPVHDPEYVEYVERMVSAFFVSGFGPDTQVRVFAKLEAGSRQDGTPASQLVIIPNGRTLSEVHSL